MDAILGIFSNLFSDIDLDSIISTITGLFGDFDISQISGLLGDFDISAITGALGSLF